MKGYLAVVLAFGLGLTGSASAQKAKDAVIVDPKVHNVLFENDHVRVFEARASYPAASPMHSHPPFVFRYKELERIEQDALSEFLSKSGSGKSTYPRFATALGNAVGALLEKATPDFINGHPTK